MCSVDNEDAVEAAPSGDTPTTSEWSTISYIRSLTVTYNCFCHKKENLFLDIVHYIVIYLQIRLNRILLCVTEAYKIYVAFIVWYGI